MDLPTDHYDRKQLKETSLDKQNQRRFISPQWQPRGSERFVYQKALGDQMNIIGGPGDHFEATQRRFLPATSCQDTLDCHCGEHS